MSAIMIEPQTTLESSSPSMSVPPSCGAGDSSPKSLAWWEKTSHEGVYAIVLARPKEHNALSKQLLADLESCLDYLAAYRLPEGGDDNEKRAPLKAVILRSSEQGKFCAGADLKERRTMSETEVVASLGSLRSVFDKVASFPSPIIAALDGPTLGGGLELAIACDFRVASESVAEMLPLSWTNFTQVTELLPGPAAHVPHSFVLDRQVKRIGFPETGLGIIPGAGGTQRAPRLLGLTKAKELIYTGRLLSATEANEWGLVDYLSDEGQDAYQRALKLASFMSNSGESTRKTKRGLPSLTVSVHTRPSLLLSCQHLWPSPPPS